MTSPYYADDRATVLHGDCLELMAAMPDASFDAIVTDPPYGLGFMGKAWDSLPPGIEWASECLRILKPGGHLLAFGGSRTWHRLACAVEDAGFEIRDSIAWLYGSGFPKSLDVSKAIDKSAGALAHESVAFTVAGRTDKNLPNPVSKGYTPPVPATPDAARWTGWGTALKPAFEPVVMARKPLPGTVAQNVLAHGTGALNIDACRVGDGGGLQRPPRGGKGSVGGWADYTATEGQDVAGTPAAGRWPANVVLDESQAEALDEVSAPGDKCGASRFFYVAKAPQSERPKVNGIAHPTVKPLTFMQWLIRLVTPPGGLVLDPFAGSGTTVEAALRERVRITAIEREADYLPLILHRIERHEDAPEPEPSLFDLEQPA